MVVNLLRHSLSSCPSRLRALKAVAEQRGDRPNNVVTDPSKGDTVNIVYGKVLTNATVGAATATINFVG
jgi:hypothetical protein